MNSRLAIRQLIQWHALCGVSDNVKLKYSWFAGVFIESVSMVTRLTTADVRTTTTSLSARSCPC